MKQFVVLYFAPTSALEQMKNSTPEDMKKGMQEWMKWAERCGDKLVDLGNPLGNGLGVDKNGSSSSQKGIAGYSVLQAENMEEIKELLKGHPHLGWTDGCQIEVYEKLPLPEC